MAQELINLGISPEVIKPIVNTHIKAMIVEALGGTQNLVDKAVEGFLKTTVDKNNGQVSSGSYNTTTLFNYYFNSLMAESVREAIKEVLTENREDIKNAIKKSLMRNKGDVFAAAILDCVNGSFTPNGWRASVSVGLRKKTDEY